MALSFEYRLVPDVEVPILAPARMHISSSMLPLCGVGRLLNMKRSGLYKREGWLFQKRGAP